MDSFIKQLKKELQRMSREQVVHFAWLCAIRALPFVGAKGDFKYWEEIYRKRYLYYIFRLLDVSYYSIFEGANAADEDLDAYYKGTGFYYHFGDPYKQLNSYPDRNAGYSASSAVRATHFAYEAAADYDKYDDYDDILISTAVCAINAAAYYDAKDDDNDDCNYNGIYSTNMQNILLADIKNIQKGGRISYNDLNWYGEIWSQFLLALDNEGCFYWRHLYNEFFEKSFELDRKALKKRLTVPFEICEQGADAVAVYLKKNE